MWIASKTGELWLPDIYLEALGNNIGSLLPFSVGSDATFTKVSVEVGNLGNAKGLATSIINYINTTPYKIDPVQIKARPSRLEAPC